MTAERETMKRSLSIGLNRFIYGGKVKYSRHKLVYILESRRLWMLWDTADKLVAARRIAPIRELVRPIIWWMLERHYPPNRMIRLLPVLVPVRLA